MFPLVYDTVVIDVTKSVLVADIGLKTHIIIDDVVKRIEMWQAKLQVFTRVTKLIACNTIVSSASTASQVVKDFILEFSLIERNQITLNIEWTILRSELLYT